MGTSGSKRLNQKMPERLISNIEEIKLVVMTLLSWAARLAFKSNLTIGIVIRQLIMALLIGFIAAEFISESPLADWQNTAIFCGAVFLADDILVMLLAFGTYAKDNQQSIFKRISSFLTGGK